MEHISLEKPILICLRFDFALQLSPATRPVCTIHLPELGKELQMDIWVFPQRNGGGLNTQNQKKKTTNTGTLIYMR